MIAEEVQQLADSFVAHWNTVLGDTPELQFDYSWPSVGTLDLLTYSLRFEKKLDASQQELILGVSAYLAVIAHECWNSYPGTEANAEKSRGEDFDILISAAGKGLLKKGRFSIPISQVLRRILKEVPEQFPSYPGEFRELDPSHNYLSSFGLGVITGYSMHGKGSWKNCSEEEFRPNLKIAQRILAKSSAKYYARVFPGEPFGADELLYSANLILPPIGFEEMFPACRATAGLMQYLKYKNATEEQMRPLAENLAASPDEQISAAGFALATALTDEKPSPRLHAIALAKDSHLPFLRHAVVTARFHLGKPQGLSELIEKNDTDAAQKMLAVDRNLGLASILKLSDRLLANEAYALLYGSLLWFNPVQAKLNIGELRKKTPTLEPEIELQDIFLDLGLGYRDLADESIQEFDKKYKGKSFPARALYEELLGFIATEDERYEDACTHLRKSFELQQADSGNFFATGVTYANTVFEQKDFSETLRVAERLLEANSQFLPARLARIAALRGLGRETETKEDLEFLKAIAGMHRAVFAEMLKK